MFSKYKTQSLARRQFPIWQTNSFIKGNLRCRVIQLTKSINKIFLNQSHITAIRLIQPMDMLKFYLASNRNKSIQLIRLEITLLQHLWGTFNLCQFRPRCRNRFKMFQQSRLPLQHSRYNFIFTFCNITTATNHNYNSYYNHNFLL